MSPVRILSRLALSGLALAIVGLCLIPFLAFDTAPAIERAAELTPQHIERAQRILATNDPRRLRNGSVRTIAIATEDVDVAVNYLAHRYAAGSALMEFADGRARVRASLRTALIPGRPFINVSLTLVEGDPVPRVTMVRLGALPIPVSLAEFVVRRAMGVAGVDLTPVGHALRAVDLDDSGLRFTYQWDDDLADSVRTALVSPGERERLHAYHQALVGATRSSSPPRVSLIDLVSPVFALAEQRSSAGDPIAENRAAILVLAGYVVGQSLVPIVPEARTWDRPRRLGVRLAGRDDLAKHFIVSAVLSANTGGPFADAVGIYKEIADSRGGSGFSFSDVAADRAGSRLGTLAEHQATASRLQRQLASPLTEATLMPSIVDLPDVPNEAEFKRRFGGVDAPGYRRVIADIDARLDALPLFTAAR